MALDEARILGVDEVVAKVCPSVGTFSELDSDLTHTCAQGMFSLATTAMSAGDNTVTEEEEDSLAALVRKESEGIVERPKLASGKVEC
jgi:hypothetical protein